MTNKSKPHRPWCKIVEHPEFGQVLGWVEWDDREECYQFVRRWYTGRYFLSVAAGFQGDDEGEEAAYGCLDLFTFETCVSQ